MQPTEYFDNALHLFSRAQGYVTDELTLSGRTVHLKTPSQALRYTFLPALQHLVTGISDSSPSLTILYAENKNLPYRLPAPLWQGFNAQGYNSALEGSDVQIFFQPWQSQVFMYSSKHQTGIYWVDDAAEVPWWEATFSFRILFHFWSADLPAQLVHAGAMAHNGNGVLITGPSGSGKSTSCLNLLKAGYSYLGDDYVWVELSPTPTVHALYQTAKVEPANLHQRFDSWMPYVTNAETYRQQKAIFHIQQLMPQGWLAQAPLKAILLPNVTGQEETLFSRVAATQSLLFMAPTTLHHLPQGRQASYQKLSMLSKALPAFKWHLGYNTGSFLNSFRNFITHV